MKDFVTLRSDFDEEVVLTFISPALLEGVLFSAVLRSLERDASRKAKMDFPRLCFDVPRAKLLSMRSTPLGRGCVKSL
eukprot:7429206-Pyramimonas_sp.AAC.1